MKLLKVSMVILVMIGLALAACTPANKGTGTPTALPANTPTAAPAGLPTQAPVDPALPDSCLKNGTYLVDGQPITLVDGIAETELAPGSASKQVTRYFGNGVNIDLNSDGWLDAAFLLQQDSGGSGTFYYVAAALHTADGCQGTNALFLGDRIAPQSTTLDPGNASQVVVSYADRKAGEPMSSAPTLAVSRAFKLDNGSLVEVARPSTPAP